jgi:hypothetical protein
LIIPTSYFLFIANTMSFVAAGMAIGAECLGLEGRRWLVVITASSSRHLLFSPPPLPYRRQPLTAYRKNVSVPRHSEQTAL